MDRRQFLNPVAVSSLGLAGGRVLESDLLARESAAAGAGAFDAPATTVPAARPLVRAKSRRRLLRMSGYRPRRPTLYRVWNQGMALALIVFSLPLLVVISVALALTQGPRNVFYMGERIGLNGRPFRIIKFKTLKDAAVTATADRVLPKDSNLETTLGRPLRETRLDELPQLFNVLFGTMNLLGPRPVRAAIAERWRPLIPNYDKRFAVRPGLIGYTQALMPHSTAKTVRARLNAILCDRPVDLVQEALFLFITAASVGLWSLDVAVRLVRGALGLPTRSYAERRGLIELSGMPKPLDDAGLRLLRLDRSKAEVVASRPLAADGQGVDLILRHRHRRQLGGRSAIAGGKAVRCRGVVLSCEPRPRGMEKAYHHTIAYSHESPFQEYLIERYFLGTVLVRSS